MKAYLVKVETRNSNFLQFVVRVDRPILRTFINLGTITKQVRRGCVTPWIPVLRTEKSGKILHAVIGQGAKARAAQIVVDAYNFRDGNGQLCATLMEVTP